MSKKRLLALCTAIGVMCSAVLGATSFSAAGSDAWESKPSYEAGLASNQKAKLLADFAEESGGKYSFTITNGAAGGHQQIAGYNFAVTSQGGTGSGQAKYFQFEVENPANKQFEMFWPTLYTSAAGYQVQTKVGLPYQIYNFETKTWTDATVAAKATYYDNAACLSVPAHFKGLVRVPVSTFKGCTPAASDANDKYVFHDDLITALNMYVHIPDPDKQYTATIDNLAWISEEASKPEPEPEVSGDYTESKDVQLNPGETYKPIMGFEDGEKVTINTSASQGAVTADHKNSGSKSYQIVLDNGSEMGFKVFDLNTNVDGYKDWSKAKYLQVYVNNTCPEGSNPLELFYFQIGKQQYMPTFGATGLKLYNIETGKWSDIEVVKNSTHVHPAFGGDKIPTIQIPSGFKGYIRVPLTDENFMCLSAPNDPKAKLSTVLSNVDRIGAYCLIRGVPGKADVYFDDFGLVTYEGEKAPDYVDNTPAKPQPDYAETEDVKLNPGETYKPIMGFEDGDATTLLPAESQGEVSTEVKNNGKNSYLLSFTDGSPGGHKTFHLDTNKEGVKDWSKAKYLQFYINNTCSVDSNPLQLFYFEINRERFMLNYKAKGLKLYDTASGKWSDLEVVENSHHIVPQLGEIKCPTIQIPGGFKGYVRIPLTDENFICVTKPDDPNAKLTSALPEIKVIGMYGLIIGVPGLGKVYFDDFGLVTYEGDKAPDYVDGESQGGGNQPGQPENPYEGQDTIFTMTGVLKDQNGNIVPNATVTLNQTEQTKTNDKGQFIFKNVSTGYVELAAVGADGTDYGYITFEALTGETTQMDGLNIKVAYNTTGITVDIGMDDLGLTLLGVTEGIIDGVNAGDEQENNDENQDTPEAPNNETGVAQDAAVIILFALFVTAAAVVFSRKQKKQN